MITGRCWMIQGEQPKPKVYSYYIMPATDPIAGCKLGLRDSTSVYFLQITVKYMQCWNEIPIRKCWAHQEKYAVYFSCIIHNNYYSALILRKLICRLAIICM